MPEGPEIRREADAIDAALAGRALTRAEYRVAGLRRRGATLRGVTVVRAYSRGKAMLIEFANGLTHYSHNQLYGKWRVMAASRDPERGRRVLRVVLANDDMQAVLYSATQIDLVPTAELAHHSFLSRLGPDALDASTTPAMVAARLADRRRARTTLGALLLDQGFIAGLGNYLRSDILFAARLTHERRAGDLTARERTRLAKAIVEVAQRSYRTQGITNTAAHVRRLSAQGVKRGALRFRAYGRAGEPCWDCGTRIRRVEANGRALFVCAQCQPVIRGPSPALRAPSPRVREEGRGKG
jgi:endonuclease-8